MTDAINRPVIFKDPGNEDRMTFKRPDHPDFKTESELRRMEFSGVRINGITRDWEIWIVGERKAYGNEKDKAAFEKAYADVFGLDEVITSTK